MNTNTNTGWPEVTIEAVAKVMQRLYETPGEEPERRWQDIPENVREEWRGDALGVLNVLTRHLPASHSDVLVEALEEAIDAGEWIAEHTEGRSERPNLAEAKEQLARVKTALDQYRAGGGS